jgi:brefeldin A-inhibited guanine nucleotide-exchange protein
MGSTLDPSESAQSQSRVSEEGTVHLSSTANPSTERLSPAISDHVRGMSTSSPVDDPNLFETAKLRKTTLLDGIKKFNFKPKRVIVIPMS